MPLISLIKPTDPDEARRSKGNATIQRVNELDNTAADIAAMASSANAAMRNAAAARDQARLYAEGVEGDAREAEEARDAAILQRVAAEAARNLAQEYRNDAMDSSQSAEIARQGAEEERLLSQEARDAAAISRGAAHTSAAVALVNTTLTDDARQEAEAAALRAEAVENSLLEWQGAWVAAASYGLSDIVRQDGTAYICEEAHVSTVFSTDLAAGKWSVFAQRGAAGPGSGDMQVSVYDPTGKEADVFDRANHSGQQAISTVGGLQAALDGKSATGHGHSVAQITGLENALDGKSPTGHSHDAATTATDGFMGASDKLALDALAGGDQAELDAGTDSRKRGWGASALLSWLRAKFNAEGNAPMFACRMWVCFSGQGGTVVIKGSGNVASVVRNSPGDYTINFQTPLPDNLYAVVASAMKATANKNWTYFAEVGVDGKAANALRIITGYVSGTSSGHYNANIDLPDISIAIFR